MQCESSRGAWRSAVRRRHPARTATKSKARIRSTPKAIGMCAHAFGDFCEFCHGGNVQATDEAAAHQGMVQPLDDVKTNCSSCHAADYQAKAENVCEDAGRDNRRRWQADPLNPRLLLQRPSRSEPHQPAQPAAGQPAQPGRQPLHRPTRLLTMWRSIKAREAAAAEYGHNNNRPAVVADVVGGGAFVVWNERRLRSKRASQ